MLNLVFPDDHFWVPIFDDRSTNSQRIRGYSECFDNARYDVHRVFTARVENEAIVWIYCEFRESHTDQWVQIKIYGNKISISQIVGLENPESKLLYEKHNQQVDKLVKTLIFAVTKVSLNLALWPMCLVSYFTYYTTDMQSDAFKMPFFLW